MLEHTGQTLLTRRNLIFLAGAGLASFSRAYGFAGKEFWDSKDPAEWSSDDIAKLLAKSPWAKSTSAQQVKTQKSPTPAMSTSIPNSSPNSRNSRNTGLGNPHNPGGGNPGKRNGPPVRTFTEYKGTVVWESAAPVRAALKTNLPEGFEGHYVLGVTGIPLSKSDSKGAVDRIRQVTTLHSKGGQPLEAARAHEDTTNGTVYLFGFSREALPLTKDEKEVVFTTHMGKLQFTAKFSPKDMLYHGELSV